VELLALLGVVHQDGGRRELVAKLASVLVHQINKLLCTESINKTEWATAERREANSEDGTDIYRLISKR